MKRSTRLALATIMTVIFIASMSEASPIQGPGAIPCGDWVVDREKKDYQMALSWVMGFMSSYNHYVGSKARKYKNNGVLDEINHRSIALWMDNYCKANPLKSVYDGTLELIEEMR